MLRRVDNTSRKKTKHDSKYYNGINVCEEWKIFNNFKEWMYSNEWKPGLTIDRKDNSKGYFPGNCRVVDMHVQNANKKVVTNSKTGYTGITMTKRPNQPYAARITWKGKVFLQKRFTTIEEALKARNKCIEDNDLPHPIQTYKGK